MKELGEISDQDSSYLASNQINVDEWPDMKLVIQRWFGAHPSKSLDKVFQSADCCVERVLTSEQALQSLLLKDQVLRGRKARQAMSPIYKMLVTEANMRDDVLIKLPNSKL